MLSEVRVRQLGVIEDLTVVLGPGMTALTGETGAGKTLVVEALQLLLGGRADPVLVRGGATEAVVEGRFVAQRDGDGEEAEVVLARVVPAEGRSRAYADGQMATLAALAEMGERLVDLHGQHAHQSLFSAVAQRQALDRFGGVSTKARRAAADEVRRVEELMAEVGGNAAARAREMDFLRYQLAELDGASISGPDEDDALAAEEERLAGATGHREAATASYQALAGEDQVLDRLGAVISGLGGHPPLRPAEGRLRGLAAELADAIAELREVAEALEDDPQRLDEVTARRALLHDLRRKYAGPAGDLGGVLAYRHEAARRLEDLEGLEGMATQLGRGHAEAVDELRRAAAELGEARRQAACRLGPAVERELRELAMPRARFVVRVAEPGEGTAALAGDDVSFLLAANPGEALLPLAKVASGGELARAMLALRLVLLGAGAAVGPGEEGASAGPGTLVFDEVDAGIGGEAAVAVGRALARLGRRYQVVVVTHLPQVAAFATAQVAVRKSVAGGRTVAQAAPVAGAERVVELSRMISGRPDSGTARRHAEELLALAAEASAGDEGSQAATPTAPKRRRRPPSAPAD